LQCPSLDSLNLAGCRDLKSLPQIDCPVLDKIALGGCSTPLDKDQILALAQFSPKLSMISLANMDSLTNDMLRFIIDKFPFLQALVLVNCENLTDIDIQASNLKGVQITECKKLETIRIQGSSLTKLIVRNCMNLDQQQFDLKHLSNLKYLE